MKIELVKNNVPGLPVRVVKTVPSEKLPIAPVHIHDDIEILAGCGGRVEVRADGETMILSQGDIVIINRRVPHYTEYLEPYSSTMMIQFRIEKLRHEEFENINKYLSLILSGAEKSFVFLKNDAELFSLVEKISEESAARRKNYEIFIKGYMELLLGHLYRGGILEATEENYDRDAVRKVWPVIEYIDKNYMFKITLEQLSSTLNVNREYFCRIFKEATGITPVEYINYVRITKAENLLTTTNLSVLEISMEVGFSSVSYFNRVFKNLKRVAPSAYRSIVYAKNRVM